jgi:hypothetical protein
MFVSRRLSRTRVLPMAPDRNPGPLTPGLTSCQLAKLILGVSSCKSPCLYMSTLTKLRSLNTRRPAIRCVPALLRLLAIHVSLSIASADPLWQLASSLSSQLSPGNTMLLTGLYLFD